MASIVALRRNFFGLRTHATLIRFSGILVAGLLSVLVLESCFNAPQSPESHKLIEGSWQGVITIDGRNLGMVVHFKADGGGTIDIPSQQAYGLPLEKVYFKSPIVNFALKAGSDVATFRGELAGDTIRGGFAQAGHKGTFTMAKPSALQPGTVSAAGDIRVILRTPTGNISGSLAMPPGKGPFPVILIISGAGEMDRNGNLSKAHVVNNDLLMLAEALKKRGIASVRYDKRGVGASGGALSSSRPLLFSDLINDASRWVENLKRDKHFTKVGVLGYDEGSLVGMVAAENSRAAVYVSVAGWADTADVRLKSELAAQPRSIRVDADRIIANLKVGEPVSNVAYNLRAVLGPKRQPFLISEFQYDPVKEIARLSMPALIIQGTNDLDVGSQQAERLHRARPGSYLDLITGMNHVLKQSPSDPEQNFATYSNPDLPLDPELVQVLTAFLRSVMVPVTATTSRPPTAGGQ